MEGTSLKDLLIQKVDNYFNDNEWNHYEFDDQYSLYRAGINLRCKLKDTKMHIYCREGGLMFHFPVNIGTDDENAVQVMEFITRVNNSIALGCFQLDLDRHELNFTIYIPCEENTTYAMIDRAIRHGLYMLNEYGNELLAVMFGMKNAKDAVAEVEARTNS